MGDDEAKRRASQKTVLEREKQPTFDIVIEIIDRNTLAVYKDASEAVDYILRGWPIRPEIRKIDKTYDNKPAEIKEEHLVNVQMPLPETTQEKRTDEEIIRQINKTENTIAKQNASDRLKFSFSRKEYVKEAKKFKKVYLYAVSRTIVEKLIERLDLNAEITKNIDDADLVIAHKNFAKGGAKILNTANNYRLQIFYVKTNSMAQIQKVLKEALGIQESSQTLQGYYDDAEKALDEAKIAINKILAGAKNIELAPQNQQIRKLQHELVEQHNLESESIGEGEERHLKIVGGQDFNIK